MITSVSSRLFRCWFCDVLLWIGKDDDEMKRPVYECKACPLWHFFACVRLVYNLEKSNEKNSIAKSFYQLSYVVSVIIVLWFAD